MDHLGEALADNLLYVIIGAVVVVGMVVKSIAAVMRTMVWEQTRREIAAYVAEGSISPEQGERLLRADPSRGRHAA